MATPGRTTPPSADFARSSAGPWLIVAVAIVAAGIVAWGVASWLDEESAGPDIAATISEVADDPDEWTGEFVVVSGRVEDVAPSSSFGGGGGGDRGREPVTAFAIGDDGFPEQLLVVDAQQPGFTADEGEIVQVTGIVREFGGAQFDEAFDLDFFSGSWFGDWEGRAAIVATSIDPTVADGENGGS